MNGFHKLPECDRCRNHSSSSYLRCAIHPSGIEAGSCPDFQEDPQAQHKQAEFLGLNWVEGEEWEPEGASYYAGELIIDAVQRFTRQQQRELLDWHPLFTGRCPHCERAIALSCPPQVHWDCEECGWKDDSI